MVIKTIKEIPLKSKHVRWNFEKSEDNFHMETPLTRYYFAIIDNREANRKEISSKIANQLMQSSSWVIPVEQGFNLKVKNSDWGLLFVIYDALAGCENLNFSKLNIASKRDYKLCKKEVLSLEDYLTRIYE